MLAAFSDYINIYTGSAKNMNARAGHGWPIHSFSILYFSFAAKYCKRHVFVQKTLTFVHLLYFNTICNALDNLEKMLH